jgi:S-adenosylmethionine synthetase
MLDDSAFVITAIPAGRGPQRRVEICEHKGIGHPDSICDGVAEAVSRALSREYLRECGQVQHHNVDKALLVGGEKHAAFRRWKDSRSAAAHSVR